MTELLVGDFGGGIYRHLAAPAGHVYDAVDCLADDDGSLYQRGATVQLGTWGSPGAGAVGLAVVDAMAGAQRLLEWDSVGIHLLNDPLNPTTYTTLGVAAPRGVKPAIVGPFAVFPTVDNRLLVYAGGNKTGTAAALLDVGTGGTAMQSAVIGSNNLTSVAGPGSMFIRLHGGINYVMEVTSVPDDDHLTLARPWPGVKGTAYAITPTFVLSEYAAMPAALAGQSSAPMVVAAVGDRLVALAGNRAAFSIVRDPTNFEDTDFHQLPSDAVTLGADAMGQSLVWFTTRGVWMVDNMELDLTDQAGNVQQQLRQVSKDLILWGDAASGGACGVVGWEGNLVVPAMDDVYVFDRSGAKQSIGAAIRPLYQSYVTAGYRPGRAEVFSGHYVLPIVNSGGGAIDMLVCRLASRAAWTRWSTGARVRGVALLSSQSAGVRPELLGLGGTNSVGNIAGLTDCFVSPSTGGTDSIGTYGMTVTTNDVDLGPGNRNTLRRVQARYESTGTGTVSYALGESGSTVALSPSMGASDGEDPASYRLAKRTRRVRIKVQASAGAPNMRLRSIQLTVRPSSRP